MIAKMRLYLVVRFGHAESPDGPDGEDTSFLVRAKSILQAASLVDERLQSLPVRSSTSDREVAPYCHRIMELGRDRGTNRSAQIVMGPWIGFAYNLGRYRTWMRERDDEPWRDWADVFIDEIDFNRT